MTTEAMDKIRTAMREVGNDTVLRMLPPGHEDIPDTKREKHPTMHFVRFHTAIADSKQRDDLQKHLSGMVVCADGILVAIAANGTPEPKAEPEATKVETPDPIETLVDTLATNPQVFREMTGESTKDYNLSHTAAVKDAEPTKSRVEVKTLVQGFRISHREDMDAIDGDLQKHRNDGWQILNIASVINAEPTTPTYLRIITLERVQS